MVVSGLFPQQANIINREFPQLDLRFVGTNKESTALLAEKIASANTVIGITNFMRHKQDDILKRHANYIRITGGMSTLREVLRKEAQGG